MLDKRLGNTPRWYVTPPKDYHMRLPDEVTECVVFLGVKHNDEFVPCGTAFFVSVTSEERSDRRYTYLVTAQHVVDGLGGRETWIRLNDKEGIAQEVSLGGSPDWMMHPSDEQPDAPWADVAVLRWTISADDFRVADAFAYRTVPESMLVGQMDFESSRINPLIDSQIAYSLGPGDEVHITGLFTQVLGKRTNVPIVRTGNIAMTPREPIRIQDTFRQRMREMYAYLIEVRSFGGLSGSPVFARNTVVDQRSGALLPGGIYLLGLVHGHWDSSREAIQTASDMRPSEHTPLAQRHADETAHEQFNMGIAIVVPAERIGELLNTKELIAQRAVEDRRRDIPSLPIPDDIIY